MDEERDDERPGGQPGSPEPAETASPSVGSGPAVPVWAVPGVERPSPLAEGLALIGAGIALARKGAGVLGDVDCRDGVREVDALVGEFECFWLELVADLDTRPAAVVGVRAGSTALSFLTSGLHRSYAQAKKDVAAAKALARPGRISDPPPSPAPDLDDPGGDAEPGSQPDAGPDAGSDAEEGGARLANIGSAFAGGQITREHVDVAVRCLNGIRPRVLDTVDEDGVSGLVRVDRFLTDKSGQFGPAEVTRLAKHLRKVLDPDEDEEKFDPEAYLRRELRLYEGSDGMTLGKLQLDPAGAVWVRAALAYFAAPGKTPPKECGPHPVSDQGELPIGDERTQGQRYADALVEICRLAMDADTSTTRREPAHVLVITTPEQLADAHTRPVATGPAAAAGPAAVGPPPIASPGLADAVHTGPLSRATLARLTCDAILQAVVLDTRTGAALNLGRSQRTASLAQRKALTARDRGCIVPGCHAPPGRCDAHHTRPWSAGGNTDINGLVLLCEAHHTQVHLGTWTIVMIDGIAHIQPPPWHKLAGTGPIRNRLHDAVQQAHRLAQRLIRQQLRLDLD